MTFSALTDSEKKIYLKRFVAKVKFQDGCWEWQAATNKKGYGIFAIKGKTYKAHRVAFEIFESRVPAGLCVLHKCDNPSCVNPKHLALGNRRENNRQMCSRGRHKRGGSRRGYKNCQYEKGEKHHAAKLTIQVVKQIRKDKIAGLSYSDLSRKYNIAIGHLHRIVHRKAWKHVE